MLDQYFGVKELYEVVLRAKVPMRFGTRSLEEGEPVLYFENISISTLTEDSHPIMARGGWSNLPRVIWEDRSEVSFVLSEGVMSAVSMGILLSANAVAKKESEPLLINKREGPYELLTKRTEDGKTLQQYLTLEKWPILYPEKKTFIYEYARNVAQKKVYGEYAHGMDDGFGNEQPCLKIWQDKNLTIPADINKKYIVDYYYEYEDEPLIYSIEKERFNGLFTLEGKFYSKDETEGKNYTNLIYMPKVRIVSDINLRLGERADPTVAVFNIIGLPENTTDKKGLILEITHLNSDTDGDI